MESKLRSFLWSQASDLDSLSKFLPWDKIDKITRLSMYQDTVVVSVLLMDGTRDSYRFRKDQAKQSTPLHSPIFP